MNCKICLYHLQLFTLGFILVGLTGLVPTAGAVDLTGTPAIDWRPRVYDCPRVTAPISLDGRMDPEEWGHAPWTEEFVDIRGGEHAAPAHRTRVKMLWDDQHLYVAARMDEPHVWATFRDRDAIIYFDNDFEVFLDPDGDTHEYYELEVNALATEWDLFLVRPYRDGGPALHEWDIPGLRTAVHVDGTLNDPTDIDTAWSVEIAFPWTALAAASHRETPPVSGDVWRVNFSRVHWDTDIVEGGYVKQTGSDGKPLPEHNWVWSPQGLVNMHYPEMWGFLRFGGERPATGLSHPADSERERISWRLRQAYYALRFDLEVPDGVKTERTRAGFEAWVDADSLRWLIDQTGRLQRLER